MTAASPAPVHQDDPLHLLQCIQRELGALRAGLGPSHPASLHLTQASLAAARAVMVLLREAPSPARTS